MTKTFYSIRGALTAGLLLLGVSAASAQVIGSDLMVANGFNNNFTMPSFVQRYSGTTGQFLGRFTLGNPANRESALRYGPNGSLYVAGDTTDTINRFDPNSGIFINTVVPSNAPAARFAFGSDGLLYFFRPGLGNTVGIERVNATTGTPAGTFVPAGSGGLDGGAFEMTFGPDGNLYVVNNDRVLRYNGTTGASLGEFVSPGSGGLAAGHALLFLPDGSLLVSSGNANAVLQYDGTTGAPLGAFAFGNGLSNPFGLTLGPDNLLYVASFFNDRILRFNSSTGAFVDTFVSATANPNPTFIAFTPTIIPEPTSAGMLCLGALGMWLSRCRRDK